MVSLLERRVSRRQPIPGRSELLDEMIRREAIIHRALQTGVDQDPDVQREIENLLIGKLREQELETKLREASVAEEELRAEYESTLDKFTRPAKIRLAMLYLKTSSKMSETKHSEIRSRMDAARARALEESEAQDPSGRRPTGQGFGAMAVEYSDDQASRYRGGDIGWLDANRFEYRWPKAVLKPIKLSTNISVVLFIMNQF